MIQYQLNEQTVTDVAGFPGRVECVDAQGVLVGYFVPVEAARQALRARAFKKYDADKARRARENSPIGHTTEEVLSHLRSLDAR